MIKFCENSSLFFATKKINKRRIKMMKIYYDDDKKEGDNVMFKKNENEK